MRKIKLISSLIVLALLIGIGCVEKPAEIRVGYQPSTHHAAEFIAMDKGWFEQETGIPFTDKEFIGGAPEMEAMMAGELDIAYVGSTPAINAIAKGLEAKIVASANNEGSALVMKTDFNYSGPGDLMGKKIAALPKPSIQDTVLRAWLLDNGIKPEEVDIKFMSGADAQASLLSGAIDGFLMPEPVPTKAEVDGIGKIVMNSSDMWIHHPCCVLVVSNKLIKENPDVVERIVGVHVKATNYLGTNREEAINITAKKLKISSEVLKKSFESGRTKYNADPKLIEMSVQRFADDLLKLGVLTKPVNASDLFDFTFYEKVKK